MYWEKILAMKNGKKKKSEFAHNFILNFLDKAARRRKK